MKLSEDLKKQYHNAVENITKLLENHVMQSIDVCENNNFAAFYRWDVRNSHFPFETIHITAHLDIEVLEKYNAFLVEATPSVIFDITKNRDALKLVSWLNVSKYIENDELLFYIDQHFGTINASYLVKLPFEIDENDFEFSLLLDRIEDVFFDEIGDAIIDIAYKDFAADQVIARLGKAKGVRILE